MTVQPHSWTPGISAVDNTDKAIVDEVKEVGQPLLESLPKAKNTKSLSTVGRMVRNRVKKQVKLPGDFELEQTLRENNYFNGFENGWKPASVAVRVAEILQISSFTPGLREKIEPLYRNYRLEKWRVALDSEFKDGTLSEYLEIEMLRIFWYQTSDPWGRIRDVLTEFNSTNGINIPTSKDAISRLFVGERSMPIEKLWNLLGLRFHSGMIDAENQSDNIRILWRLCIDMPIDHPAWGGRSLRSKLARLHTGKGDSKSFQRRALKTLKSYYKTSGINLGITSWATVSRRINAFDYNHIREIDFRRFVKLIPPSDILEQKTLEQILLEYLRKNPGNFVYP